MKWRIAKKIRAAIGTPRENCYTERQKTQALDRYDRLKTSKENERFWEAMMKNLGPEGRAELFVRWGDPKTALDILMRHDEKDWPGDKQAFEKAGF